MHVSALSCGPRYRLLAIALAILLPACEDTGIPQGAGLPWPAPAEGSIIAPGADLPLPWTTLSVIDDIRVAWLLTAGDCLTCGNHVNHLREVDRAEPGATVVLLIGEPADTLNVRRFLIAHRLQSPLVLWDPDALPPSWQDTNTPDLLVVSASEALWTMNSSRANPLDVLNRFRSSATEASGS